MSVSRRGIDRPSRLHCTARLQQLQQAAGVQHTAPEVVPDERSVAVALRRCHAMVRRAQVGGSVTSRHVEATTAATHSPCVYHNVSVPCRPTLHCQVARPHGVVFQTTIQDRAPAATLPPRSPRLMCLGPNLYVPTHCNQRQTAARTALPWDFFVARGPLWHSVEHSPVAARQNNTSLSKLSISCPPPQPSLGPRHLASSRPPTPGHTAQIASLV